MYIYTKKRIPLNQRNFEHLSVSGTGEEEDIVGRAYPRREGAEGGIFRKISPVFRENHLFSAIVRENNWQRSALRCGNTTGRWSVVVRRRCSGSIVISERRGGGGLGIAQRERFIRVSQALSITGTGRDLDRAHPPGCVG